MQTATRDLERLQRHYDASVRSYDEISLLDLSHSLRIWADLKSQLPKSFPKFATTLSFVTARPTKKVLNAARGTNFVFAYMPGGVVTYAAKGEIVGAPDPTGKDFTLAAIGQHNLDGSLELRNYSYVERAVDEPTMNAMQNSKVSSGNYLQWLGADAVIMSYTQADGTLKRVSISREMLVRRVANTLGGSHPSVEAGTNDFENSYDPAVHHLLGHNMGGLPLPYFILLKIAQDLLTIAPKLLNSQPSDSSRN